mmetsp:Transcript_16693/g.34299  ORF Transcript_16693/g.34299 Transcript_16693/m.34299 type:complete len:214 (+) Transcript_16693:611-1252(+)
MSSYSDLTESPFGDNVDDEVLAILRMSEPIDMEDEIPVERGSDLGIADDLNVTGVEVEYIDLSQIFDPAPNLSGREPDSQVHEEVKRKPADFDCCDVYYVPPADGPCLPSSTNAFTLSAVKEAKQEAERVRSKRKEEIEQEKPIPPGASAEKRRRMNNLKSADASRASAAAYERSLEEALNKFELKTKLLQEENRRLREELRLVKASLDFENQ